MFRGVEYHFSVKTKLEKNVFGYRSISMYHHGHQKDTFITKTPQETPCGLRCADISKEYERELERTLFNEQDDNTIRNLSFNKLPKQMQQDLMLKANMLRFYSDAVTSIYKNRDKLNIDQIPPHDRESHHRFIGVRYSSLSRVFGFKQ